MKETLRLRFGHLIANDKPPFAVSGFTLAICPYLGIKILLPSILAEKHRVQNYVQMEENSIINKQKSSKT